MPGLNYRANRPKKDHILSLNDFKNMAFNAVYPMLIFYLVVLFFLKFQT